MQNGEFHSWGEGGGVSTNKEIAKKKAIGEAVERYCGSELNKNRCLCSRYENVKGNAIPPSSFIYFPEDYYELNYFPYEKIKLQDEINWVKGHNLVKKEEVYIPAFSVFLGYSNHFEKRISPITSNGLGAGKSMNQAIRSGLLEIIERDAAMINWYTKRTPPRVKLDDIEDKKTKRLLKKLKKDRFKVDLCFLSLDIPIAVIAAVVHSDKDENPKVVFGLGAKFNLREAIRKAVEEAIMVINSIDILKRKNTNKELRREKVDSFLDHVLYYSSSSRRKKMWKFFVEGEEFSIKKINQKFVNNKLKKVDDLMIFFRHQEKEIIAVDLTKDFIKKEGYRVVKVLSSNLQSIDVSHKYRFSDTERINQFLISKENEHPHPFG